MTIAGPTITDSAASEAAGTTCGCARNPLQESAIVLDLVRSPTRMDPDWDARMGESGFDSAFDEITQREVRPTRGGRKTGRVGSGPGEIPVTDAHSEASVSDKGIGTRGDRDSLCTAARETA